MKSCKEKLFAYLRHEIPDSRVLEVMENVPRDLFVPDENRWLSYQDIPLPIGEGQTISQPYIVALMTDALDIKDMDTVLELGTGSGYQAAILSLMAHKVYSVERVPSLAVRARQLLKSLGYENIEVKLADGELGCSEESPFDAVMVTAGMPRLPGVLLEQMSCGGRLVAPVGSQDQQSLVKVSRMQDGYRINILGLCRFVPLLGKGAWSVFS